jgi:hypothetical protein
MPPKKQCSDQVALLEKLEGLDRLLKAKFARIDEKIDTFIGHNKEDHAAVKERLTQLNGQTAKNTEFRNRAVGIYLGLSGAVGAVMMFAGLLINTYL